MAQLSERLKQTRKEKLLSIRKLSVLSKVSSAYISQLESEHSKTPSYSIVSKLAGALETTTEYIMGDAELPEKICGMCRFFVEEHHKAGDCHRYPPTQFIFRRVEVTDWCGEWKGKHALIGEDSKDDV